MLRNGLRQSAPEPGGRGGLAGQRREPLLAQRVPGDRPGQVPPPTGQGGVQRGGVCDVLLDDVLLEVADGEGQPAVRGRGTGLDRVASRFDQCEQFVVVVEVGNVEAGHPLHCGQCVVPRPAQRFGQRVQLGPRRYPVEAADPDVDGVDGPAAEQGEKLVAGLLDGQPAFHDGPVVAGHLHHAVVAEEVRRVQQVDVQRVAFDPLAAVQQPSQVGQGSVHGDPAGVLDRSARRHLVGHRADPADPGGDVGRLGVSAPAQQRLEEPGRLVDLQPDVGDHVPVDPHVHGALALDPGQPGDAERTVASVRHDTPPLWSPRVVMVTGRAAANAGAPALKVRNTRATPASSRPTSRSRAISAGVLTRRGRAEAAVAAPPVGRAQRAAAGPGHRAQAGCAVRDQDARRAAGLALEAHAVPRQVRLAPQQQRGQRVQQLPPVDRAAVELQVDWHVRRRRGRGVQCGQVLGMGVDERPELRHVGEVAQRLDAAGGGAGSDRHEQAGLGPDPFDPVDVAGRGDGPLDQRDVVRPGDGRARRLREVRDVDLAGDRQQFVLAVQQGELATVAGGELPDGEGGPRAHHSSFTFISGSATS